MDGRSRVARVKVFGATWSGSQWDAKVYNLEDHLGNSTFSVDANSSLIYREEYFPFGETSFGSYSRKRYRFCGKERDEESGLYYYGARYYAPWSCRFVSLDPLASKYPFYTPYQYAGNRPINFIDLDGLEPATGKAESDQSPAMFSKDANGESKMNRSLDSVQITDGQASQQERKSTIPNASALGQRPGAADDGGFWNWVGDAGEKASIFALSAIQTIASNQFWGVSGRVDPKEHGKYELSARWGQLVGDALSILIGLGQMGGGAADIASSPKAVALLATPGGVVTAPVAGGVAVGKGAIRVVHGGGVVFVSGRNLIDDLSILFSASGGGGGEEPPQDGNGGSSDSGEFDLQREYMDNAQMSKYIKELEAGYKTGPGYEGPGLPKDHILSTNQLNALSQNLKLVIQKSIPKQTTIESLQSQLNQPRWRFIDQIRGGRNALNKAINGKGAIFPW
jgi:RHS repeat-associated protein